MQNGAEHAVITINPMFHVERDAVVLQGLECGFEAGQAVDRHPFGEIIKRRRGIRRGAVKNLVKSVGPDGLRGMQVMLPASHVRDALCVGEDFPFLLQCLQCVALIDAEPVNGDRRGQYPFQGDRAEQVRGQEIKRAGVQRRLDRVIAIAAGVCDHRRMNDGG